MLLNDYHFRPWYISAATQKSKDVVFLVDVSKNINTKLSKELVETFLKTLDPRDKVDCSLIHILLLCTIFNVFLSTLAQIDNPDISLPSPPPANVDRINFKFP